MVPQADVVERAAVGLEIGARQRTFARQFALLDLVQREGLARGGDVVFDERCLADLFVRRDREALEHRGVAFATEHRQNIERRARNQQPFRTTGGRGRGQAGGDDGGAHEKQRHGHARVDVGVARALDDSRRLDDFVEAAEPRTHRQREEEHRGEPGEVAAGAVLNGHAERRERHLAGRDIQRRGTRGGEQHQAHHQAAHEFKSGQREDVEAGVVPQHGIDLAERPLVPPGQHRHPLARRVRRHQERGPDDGEHDEGAELIAGRQRDGEAFFRRERDRRGRNRRQRHPHVQHQPGGSGREHCHAQHGARGDLGGVDGLVPDLAEPHPVREEVDCKGQEEEERSGQQEDDKS